MSAIFGTLFAKVTETFLHEPGNSLVAQDGPLRPTPSEQERDQAKQDFAQYKQLLERRQVIRQLYKTIVAARKSDETYEVHGKPTKKLLKAVKEAGIELDTKKRHYSAPDCQKLLELLNARCRTIEDESMGYYDKVTIALGKHEKLQGVLVLDTLPGYDDSRSRSEMQLLEELFQYVNLLDPKEGIYQINDEKILSQLVVAKDHGYIKEAKRQYTVAEMKMLLADIQLSFKPFFERYKGKIDRTISSP